MAEEAQGHEEQPQLSQEAGLYICMAPSQENSGNINPGMKPRAGEDTRNNREREKRWREARLHRQAFMAQAGPRAPPSQICWGLMAQMQPMCGGAEALRAEG